MTLFDVIVPPSPLQAMLGVRRATVQQKFLLITSNIALYGGGEAQIHFYIGGLIIFVRDCRLSSLRSSL